MSNPWVDPWSNSSTAPEIAIFDYNVEKATFAGSFIGAILYGTPAHTFIYSRSLRLFGLS